MVALTNDQYKEIIGAMKRGSVYFRPNRRIAAVLTAEANLGMRVGDILKMKLSDIVKDGGRYRLNVVEEKTGKKRTFSVPTAIYKFFCDYARESGISKDERLFPITERAVQKYLKSVCDYLGYENISTHSFRKWYATDIYNASGHDIVLVQHLLQHSSPTITRRYIGMSEERVEDAITRHVNIV